MATILKRNGRRSIQFVDPAGHRKTLALGKMSQKQAEFIKVKVEALVAACISGHADDEVNRWLATRDTVLLDKLAAVRLIAKRSSAALGQFLESFVAGRIDVKPATKEIWAQSVRNLTEFFGRDKPLRAITAGDAENFRLNLVGQGLAATTVHKRLQVARQFFRMARRHRLIAENPFDEVRHKAGGEKERQRFITREDTARVLEACPSINWRVIVTLSRYGGLRCPSEVLSLRWQDIDWAGDRLVITSPKTEHHPGKGTRTIPLFPELRLILTEAFAAAPEGAVFVVDERYRKGSQGPHGWRNANLRTTFEKIIRRAGLEPWPRPFHNLRASRETELAERFPIHVVTAWLGNTPEIARKHYLQVTEEHFRQASEPAERAANALQQPAAMPCNGQQKAGEGPAGGDGRAERDSRPCKDLPTPAKVCAAHLSLCQERENWGIRIRTLTS